MSKLSSVIGQYINKYKMMKPKELSALAEKGDAEAMYELGKKLYSGKGVSKSYEEAREMFEMVRQRVMSAAVTSWARCSSAA